MTDRSRSYITFCVTPAPFPRQLPLLHHFLCYTNAGYPPTAALTSLFVSHRHRLTDRSRSYITFCVTPVPVTRHCRSCITFCVTPAPFPRQLPLLHHFLCHTNAGSPPTAALASLFVSHQHRFPANCRSCITFCVTPTPVTRQLPLLHHFLCHTNAGYPTTAALTSLFVSHQHRFPANCRSCITFCVTPAPVDRPQPLLHHFLCHTSTGYPPTAALTSLFVLHQRRFPANCRSYITFCVTPTPVTRQLPLLYHLLCYTSTGYPTTAALASLFVLHHHRLPADCRSYITFCVTPAPVTRQLPLLHHFLCHTNAGCPPTAALTSLFVLHQHRFPANCRSYITFCVTPAPAPESRPTPHMIKKTAYASPARYGLS